MLSSSTAAAPNQRLTTELTEIADLLAKCKMQSAEERLSEVLKTFPPNLLASVRQDLETLATSFFNKRRRNIETLIRAAMLDGNHQPHKISPAPTTPPARDSAHSDTMLLSHLTATFDTGFDNLRERHIFQWSTRYREFLFSSLEQALDIATRGPLPQVSTIASTATAKHAQQIFEKGYEYKTKANAYGLKADYAINKSLSGLEHFLSLPIDWYTTAIHAEHGMRYPSILREIVSAFLSGILLGYVRTHLGSNSGAQILPRFPRTWMPHVVFLTARDLKTLIFSLEAGEVVTGLSHGCASYAACSG
jgi:hypothetical protein